MTGYSVLKAQALEFVAGTVFALISLPLSSATVDIAVSSNAFSPAQVTINQGDQVRWLWQGGDHTVTSGADCSADRRFDFAADGSSTLAGSFTFTTAGTFPYFCRFHCGIGMTGQIIVAAAPKRPTVTTLDNPIPATIQLGAAQAKLQPIVRGLTAPNWGTTAPGESNRLFVTDQIGTVWAIDVNSKQKKVFADLSGLLVKLGVFGGKYDERGLLGLAFHPDYTTNGLLYTFTSEPRGEAADFTSLANPTKADHQNLVREWHVPNPTDPASVVDPTSSRVVLRIDHPYFNHNGGALVFGADNLLYVAIGDGGNADDQGRGHLPGGNGQSLKTVLGKILRIDPDGRTSANNQYAIPSSNPFVPGSGPITGGQDGCADGQCDEIYAYGLRNPFRMSFDRNVGLNTLFAADVGQNDVEEIDLIAGGNNYGWRKTEGRFCFHPNGSAGGTVSAINGCNTAGLTEPLAQYDHDEGKAIIGGFVYRGSLLPALSGHYIFADYARTFKADGRLFYLNRSDIKAGDSTRSGIAELDVTNRKKLGIAVLGFGQDTSGEVYVLGNRTGTPTRRTGVVYKLTN